MLTSATTLSQDMVKHGTREHPGRDRAPPPRFSAGTGAKDFYINKERLGFDKYQGLDADPEEAAQLRKERLQARAARVPKPKFTIEEEEDVELPAAMGSEAAAAVAAILDNIDKPRGSSMPEQLNYGPRDGAGGATREGGLLRVYRPGSTLWWIYDEKEESGLQLEELKKVKAKAKGKSEKAIAKIRSHRRRHNLVSYALGKILKIRINVAEGGSRQSTEALVQWGVTGDMAHTWGWTTRGWDRKGWAIGRGYNEWIPMDAAYGHASLDPACSDGALVAGSLDFVGEGMANSKFCPCPPGTEPALRPADLNKLPSSVMRVRELGTRAPFDPREPTAVGWAARAGTLYSYASADAGLAVAYLCRDGESAGTTFVVLDPNDVKVGGADDRTGMPLQVPAAGVHAYVAAQLALEASARSYYIHEDIGKPELILLADDQKVVHKDSLVSMAAVGAPEVVALIEGAGVPTFVCETVRVTGESGNPAMRHWGSVTLPVALKSARMFFNLRSPLNESKVQLQVYSAQDILLTANKCKGIAPLKTKLSMAPDDAAALACYTRLDWMSDGKLIFEYGHLPDEEQIQWLTRLAGSRRHEVRAAAAPPQQPLHPSTRSTPAPAPPQYLLASTGCDALLCAQVHLSEDKSRTAVLMPATSRDKGYVILDTKEHTLEVVTPVALFDGWQRVSGAPIRPAAPKSGPPQFYCLSKLMWVPSS